MTLENIATTSKSNFFSSTETVPVNITPQKPLTPKQLKRKLESEKKRQLKEQEKEEREKKRQEEKEEREKKKQEAKDELEKQKLKEKEEKQKQKDEKDEKKRLEREAKLKEKEDKKKEKEEKEEMKRKEIEEKERKKQMELEQKEKAAMVFSKFFVPKKADTSITEENKEEVKLFMPFSVKPDMRVAPICRRQLIKEEKDTLTKCLDNQQANDTYLKDLKSGKTMKRKSDKTWTVEENDDDVMIMEENNEIIIAQERKIETMRAKMLKFHENRRPAYFGTWRKRSKTIKPKKPFVMDTTHIDYDVDSDDDWEEEVQGESLAGSDDEDKENVSENDYEEDNEFFVPHGYLSEGEGDDEDNVPMSPESHKAKLKLLKSSFEEEINSKTERLKPRLIGCVWEEKTLAKVQDAFRSFLQARAMITNGTIQIKKRDSVAFQTPSTKKSLSERKHNMKQLSKELIPTFLQLVHGNVKNQMFIINEFLNYMAAKNLPIEISKSSLGHHLKVLATWMKCPEEGPLHNKYCWYVSGEIRQQYNVDVAIPNKWNYTASA